MLILTRRAGEKIFIGDDIGITIIESSSGRVRIGIEAPKNTTILREELKLRDEKEGNSYEQRHTI